MIRYPMILMAAVDENGSGGSGTKQPTLLSKIHQEWLSKGGKRPDQKTLESLKKEIASATDEFEAAAAALQAAREKRQQVSLKVMRACGTKGTLKLADGRLLEATARGDVVFFRSTSGETY